MDDKVETWLPQIYVALGSDQGVAKKMMSLFTPSDCGFKVDTRLFMRAGPSIVRQLKARKFSVFLDLKLHDMPNTVAETCRDFANLGVDLITLHALGTAPMLDAAVRAVRPFKSRRPQLLGVTVLTGHDDCALQSIGITETITDSVKRLAYLSLESGLDGVVCSPCETRMLREAYGDDFLAVTPGIRFAQGVKISREDQRRTMSPKQAILEGSDHLVIGRPITDAVDPVAALMEVRREIRQAYQLI